MLVVLDTNILVSGLLSPEGNCARILALFSHGSIKPCYDTRIFAEYTRVLAYDRLHIKGVDATNILNAIRLDGCPVVAQPSFEPFTDEADRKFFEVAKSASAPLITGNVRHYPISEIVLNPKLFLQHFTQERSSR